MSGWHSGLRIPQEPAARRVDFTHGAWCDVCKRNGPVHDHKCKDCGHVEDGKAMNIHRDGYCMFHHPTLGFKISEEMKAEMLEAFNTLVPK